MKRKAKRRPAATSPRRALRRRKRTQASELASNVARLQNVIRDMDVNIIALTRTLTQVCDGLSRQVSGVQADVAALVTAQTLPAPADHGARLAATLPPRIAKTPARGGQIPPRGRA